MAVKDSGELQTSSGYTLGDYSFRIERTSVPGSTNDKIEAICTDKDGKNARKSIQVPSSTQLDGWYVEANETEATVYALKKVPSGASKTSDLDTGPYGNPTAMGGSPLRGEIYNQYLHKTQWWLFTALQNTCAFYTINGRNCCMLVASDTYNAPAISIELDDGSSGTRYTTQSFVHNGKTVYYNLFFDGVNDTVYGGLGDFSESPGRQYYSAAAAWTMVYGEPSGDEYELKEVMVGRFAIEVEEAGGVGPGGGTGGGWTDPEDYDEDWEEGDPTHTLYVEVTGALSGRHNDPIVDPSYSYIPADKDTVKDYGCGGDGGHGGGGGAGASTVVIHKFATNQANSKEVTAIARRHGYGSGGGKGGKGGDGCILVYY